MLRLFCATIARLVFLDIAQIEMNSLFSTVPNKPMKGAVEPIVVWCTFSTFFNSLSVAISKTRSTLAPE